MNWTHAVPVSYGEWYPIQVTTTSGNIEVRDSDDQSWVVVSPRARPGLIVLSSSMRVLYVDRHAAELLQAMNQLDRGVEIGTVDHRWLPVALRKLCAGIVDTLKTRTDARDWTQFECSHVAGDLLRPVLLRGFGIPDRRGIERARIVMTMEEAVPRQQLSPVPQRAVGDEAV